MPIVLIRHAMVDRIGHRTEWPLSADGRAATRALAAEIAEYNIDRIFSSTERKAQETAEIIAAELGVEWHTADGLHEHLREKVKIMPREEFLASVERFFEQPDELVFGDETAAEALGRFRAAIDALHAKHPGETLAIASHGTVITLYVNYVTGESLFDLWKSLKLPDIRLLPDQST